MNFKCQQEARSRSIGLHLQTQLARLGPGSINDAMSWALSGGKRFRGFLAMESSALYDVGEEQSIWAAAAIEAIHAYSLVHDDLPAMDDDDLRRGRPTVHIRWNEATAILAGDALQSFAFELLSSAECGPADRRVRLIRRLARAAGGAGMVAGQAADLAAETAKTPLKLEFVAELQEQKTGALIEWAGEVGPILSGEDPKMMQVYARSIGQAFQIADDLLDVEGDESQTGKRLRKDHAAGKATFVSLLGEEAARQRAEELIMLACDTLASFGAKADTLRDLAHFVMRRKS